ncbi:hypothetical protein [Mucilaginibacter lacusdianchii]|uniref:hypothetical protein n=1 Tax=Mucilaginibacter lacusdianchii TaxID=2684211 RepID=UPI00131B32A1|nr:hypothetical protein [Mucilaginibacter sp. JXJ CY 39]
MKRILLTLLVTVAFVFGALAQSNYKPGYVVKANGDTLKGYINYKEWRTSPKFIDFKPALSQPEVSRFLPAMLRSFEVKNMDKYITYTGSLSADKNDLPDLPNYLDTTTRQDTVFMEVVYQGTPLSLLSHQDDVKRRLFVKEESEIPKELKYYQYIQTGLDGRSNIQVVNAYRTSLLRLAQKYNSANFQEITKPVRFISYTESDVSKILKLINNDKSETGTGNFGSRLFAGAAFAHIVTQFDGTNRFANQPYTTNFPRISAGVDLLFNKHTQKNYIRAELSFISISPSFYSSNQDSKADYYFSQKTITFTPQLVYSLYNKDKFKVFIGAGAGFNYSFYSNQKANYYSAYSSYTSSDMGYSLAHFWVNFPVQAGATIGRKIDIFTYYTGFTAFTTYGNFSIANKIYGAGLHYFFYK